MKLVPVDPNEIEELRSSRRGRISYPILKMFLESGSPCSQLDRTGVQQSMLALSSSLGAYARSHNLPVKLIQRKGELYLLRLDINADGTPNTDYNPDENTGDEADKPVLDLTPSNIEERLEQEKPLVTK